jgi:hypothetical protein
MGCQWMVREDMLASPVRDMRPHDSPNFVCLIAYAPMRQ